VTIVDFHTHVFPDALAERAIPALEEEGDITAVLDGKLSSLLRSMDEAGIERSVACSIATRPEQFEAIMHFSREIASERIIPFPSVHPDDPQAAAHVRVIAEEGFRGIKFHPYYQDFDLLEDRMQPIYAAAQDTGLLVAVHTGFDLAFPRVRKADPRRVVEVTGAYPRLRLITTHLGGWEDWDEVRRHLLGKPYYMELSFCFGLLSDEAMRDFLLAHPREYLLFGTDSPWVGQRETLDALRALDLEPALLRCILAGNAARLLEAPAA
jgi:predicted TIM-barrel fold metal-dependent hydrolase